MKGRKLSKDKQIVVTGGAGFIGSALIRHLNDQGYHNAVIVDDLGEGDKWKNLRGKMFSDIVPIYDLFDWLEDRADDLQAIVHLGANSSTVEKDADALLINNTRYSIELAEYAAHHEIRFIYASSAATYGDGKQGFSDEVIDGLEPLNMYGFSKHAFDQWVLRHGLLNEFVGLKFFNVFGPNEGHKGRMASMVYQMFHQIQDEGKVSLFKDGNQKRDFIYVKDAVRMIGAFLENNESGMFNIGSGIASTWNALAEALFKAMNKSPKIKYIDMSEDLIGKYQEYTCAEVNKLQDLGLSAMPLEEAIADYVQNHLLVGKSW